MYYQHQQIEVSVVYGLLDEEDAEAEHSLGPTYWEGHVTEDTKRPGNNSSITSVRNWA